MQENKLVELVPKSSAEAEKIRADVRELLEYVSSNECVGIASVVVRADGTVGWQTRACGNRALLLGAVTDLQYTLAKDGDKT